MYIYLITNKLNGMQYVGQTTRDYKLRFKEHIESALYDKTKNSYLYNAIKKYGKHNFQIDLIESTLDLNTKEQFWIKELGTMWPNGYNFLPGGKSNYNLTLDHKLKLSKPLKATNKKTNETFYFLSLSQLNKKYFSSSAVSIAIKNKEIYYGYYWEHVTKEEYLENQHKNNIYPEVKIYAVKDNTIIKIYYHEHISDYGFCSAKVGPILKNHPGRKTHKGYKFYNDLPVQATDMPLQ